MCLHFPDPFSRGFLFSYKLIIHSDKKKKKLFIVDGGLKRTEKDAPHLPVRLPVPSLIQFLCGRIHRFHSRSFFSKDKWSKSTDCVVRRWKWQILDYRLYQMYLINVRATKSKMNRLAAFDMDATGTAGSHLLFYLPATWITGRCRWTCSCTVHSWNVWIS